MDERTDEILGFICLGLDMARDTKHEEKDWGFDEPVEIGPHDDNSVRVTYPDGTVYEVTVTKL